MECCQTDQVIQSLLHDSAPVDAAASPKILRNRAGNAVRRIRGARMPITISVEAQLGHPA